MIMLVRRLLLAYIDDTATHSPPLSWWIGERTISCYVERVAAVIAGRASDDFCCVKLGLTIGGVATAVSMIRGRQASDMRKRKSTPCRAGTIHLQTSMSSPGFEPRPYGTAVSVAHHCTGLATLFLDKNIINCTPSFALNLALPDLLQLDDPAFCKPGRINVMSMGIPNSK
ncbi:hypothetical protein TNCV_714521 [Trichonephila clavipes]|nr:hypothetical protein TNCV_714521 [Trichonephila clavipes]